jgi:hypothetical protein
VQGRVLVAFVGIDDILTLCQAKTVKIVAGDLRSGRMLNKEGTVIVRWFDITIGCSCDLLVVGRVGPQDGCHFS